MQTVRIGVSGTADDIFDTLSKGFEKDRSYEIAIIVAGKNNPKGKTEILFHSKTPGGLGIDTIRSLSKELTQYIIKRHEKDLIRKIIQNNYDNFSNSEQDELAELVINKIIAVEKDFYGQNPREVLIYEKLEDYLKSSESIHLEGFINFRLQEYMMRLEEYVELAADEYMAKREYNEFIRLLRCFVDMQKPIYRKVHIVADKEGFYEILNDKQADITLECAKEFMAELEEGASFDDILVSSLITMSPRRIVLHGSKYFKNKELLDTIKNVFPGRCIICSRCTICDKIQ